MLELQCRWFALRPVVQFRVNCDMEFEVPIKISTHVFMLICTMLQETVIVDKTVRLFWTHGDCLGRKHSCYSVEACS